jgi:MtrB/PioB family decaheme-associated outer membrane protein
MKKILMVVSVSMIVMPACPAFADGTFDGEAGGTALFTHVNGNDAKFNEYRDLRDGFYTNLRLKYDTDDYFIKVKAFDIGYDTQKYSLEGGMYGKFKAYVDYSEIPHNFTFGAETFYSGAGTNRLTYTPRIPPSSAWQPFDYSTKRQAVEVGFSVDRIKPFFFDFSSPHEEKTGTYPTGVAYSTNGSRPLTGGASSIEIPQPIDYRTNALNMTAGYAKNPYFAAVNFYYSQFDNANSVLYFDRPTGPTTSIPDAYSLPPDNEAYKIAFKGSVKLPLNSQFSTNLATSRMSADENVLLATTTTFGPVFHGKVRTDNLDFVLTSNPVHLLSTKVYYKYNDRKNESDQLSIENPVYSSDTPANTLYGYDKRKMGIDLGWNLPAKFKLDTTYSYLITRRQAEDEIPETRDNTLSAELKYRGLDFMTPKIGYEWMQRSADHEPSIIDPDPGDAIQNFIWRFDVAPKTQNTLKASIDIFPLPNLNFNIGYKYVDVNYSNTILGLRSTRSNQVNLDVGYTLGKIAQLNAYYDLEIQKNYQFQRTYTANATADPNSTPSASNYNWDVKFKDNSYSWGFGSEIYLMPKTLSLLLQYDNVNSNGNADFTYLFASALAAGRTNDNIDMANWDDYRLSSYSAKIRYTTTTHYTFTVGYAYESYKYNSSQFDNYLMVQGTNYLTGAYANPNYDAQVVFAAVEYKF